MFMIVLIEVTQDSLNWYNSPGDSLYNHTEKASHWWRIQSGIFIHRKGNHFVLATPYMLTKKRGRTEISTNFQEQK